MLIPHLIGTREQLTLPTAIQFSLEEADKFGFSGQSESENGQQ